MTKVERLAAIFGIAFAVIYAPTMDYNWTFATYHPIQGFGSWVAPRPSAEARQPCTGTGLSLPRPWGRSL